MDNGVQTNHLQACSYLLTQGMLNEFTFDAPSDMLVGCVEPIASIGATTHG